VEPRAIPAATRGLNHALPPAGNGLHGTCGTSELQHLSKGETPKVRGVGVRGDSMVGDNIIDGDCVIVTQDSEPNSGEMVIALINGEATVKRLRREGELIRLESSNPDQEKFPPIFVDYHDNSEIQGRVVGVIRWLR
jgi:repressor LexA